MSTTNKTKPKQDNEWITPLWLMDCANSRSATERAYKTPDMVEGMQYVAKAYREAADVLANAAESIAIDQEAKKAEASNAGK
jgi:hypothetical protein